MDVGFVLDEMAVGFLLGEHGCGFHTGRNGCGGFLLNEWVIDAVSQRTGFVGQHFASSGFC